MSKRTALRKKINLLYVIISLLAMLIVSQYALVISCFIKVGTVERSVYKTLKLNNKHYKDIMDLLNTKMLGITVRVSAYTPSSDETDSTPTITAVNTEVEEGTVAVSRDLLGFLNFGDSVYLEGIGVFKVTDVMNRRYKRAVDVLMLTKKQALKFGVKENVRMVKVNM